MTVNEEYCVEVDCNSLKFMLSSANIGLVFGKLKMVGNTDTNADGVLFYMAYFTLI
jgi:hypothetical protein